MAAAAVIFDLDGTIWDSLPWYATVLAGAEPLLHQQHLARLRKGSPAARMLRDAGISPKRFERVCAARDAVPLYEDVLAVIRQLADEDIALGAVTNLPGWMAGPMLRCHELDEYFESAVTYERTTKRKPHPAPLLLCCQELDVAADEDTWYVGDSVGDYQAAQAAGLSFAWASWGYGSSAPLGSSMTLDGLNDLLAL